MQAQHPRKISLVIPACNEEQNIRPLFDEISDVARQHDLEPEIIFIDDGSTDATWSVIADLAARHPHVTGLRFRRNFGKAAALAAGFQTANTPVVFTLDADLQDDPHEIPNLLEKLDQGYDLVVGWKKHRQDPWHKTFPSKVFNLLVSLVAGPKLHDHNCGFKCFRRAVLDEIELYGELHRFIPVLAGARGFRVAEIPVHHRRRVHGRSKYGLFRFIKGLLDLMTVRFLTRFGRRPSHVLGTVGLLAFACGALGLLTLGVEWFRGNSPVENPALLAVSGFAVLFAMQMIFLGLLGELVVARSATLHGDYSIAERTPCPATSTSVHEPVDDPASAVH